jgi:hypothetical protein
VCRNNVVPHFLGLKSDPNHILAGTSFSGVSRCPAREHREDIALSLYYRRLKELLEADKRRPLTGDTARVATSSEANDLRREAQVLKKVVPI